MLNDCCYRCVHQFSTTFPVCFPHQFPLVFCCVLAVLLLCRLYFFFPFPQSEYIAPCDKRRAFISGFNGSNGGKHISANTKS